MKSEVTISKGVLANAIGIAFSERYYFDPFHRYETDLLCHDYVNAEFREFDAFFSESNLGRKEWYTPKQVLVGGIQPNLILAILLGAQLVAFPTQDADIVWKNGTPDASDLPSIDSLLQHDLVVQFDQQIDAVEAMGLEPIPPFFWDASGRAAVHGVLTTAHKLLGDNFFLEMSLSPDKLEPVLQWIVDAYITLIRHFADRCSITITSLHVGECAACMVSPGSWEQIAQFQFEPFAAQLGPIRLHSCGPSNTVLSRFEKIPSLAALDLGGETSMKLVRESFGPELPVTIAPPVKFLVEKTPDALLAWLEQTVAENASGNLSILYHIEPNYNLDVLRAFHTAIGRIEMI